MDRERTGKVDSLMELEDILRLSQKDLKKGLLKDLQKLNYKPVSAAGFLYAAGNVPVLLVAHLDTVHTKEVETICRSGDGSILMSPQGIGGDDRAGVYMVMELVKTQKCHVLFCEDEEIGGLGAKKFVASGIRPSVNYILELDRRGKWDAVFYNCANPDFTNFICEFGFTQERGSFSDISEIAPALEIAAVNLSAGYFSPHSTGEYIDLSVVGRNIEIVKKMVETPTSVFQYMSPPGIKHYSLLWKYIKEYYNQPTLALDLDKEVYIQSEELFDIYEKTIEGYRKNCDEGELLRSGGNTPADCTGYEVAGVFDPRNELLWFETISYGEEATAWCLRQGTQHCVSVEEANSLLVLFFGAETKGLVTNIKHN